jgi:hypothetical protein
MAHKIFSEADALRIARNAGVKPSKASPVLLELPEKSPGIRAWAALDFLRNYCRYLLRR